MAEEVIGEQWILYECGFSPLVFDEGKAKSIFRKVFVFDWTPVVLISSVWDACHMHGHAGPGGGADLTLGRWRGVVKEVKTQFDGEEIASITEIGTRTILKTASGRILVSCGTEVLELTLAYQSSESSHVIKVSDSDQDPTLEDTIVVDTIVQQADNTYTLLSNGRIHLSTFSSDSVLELSRPVLPTVTIKQVVCGSDHLLMLGKTCGRVWSSGLNTRGQLGHGDLHARPHPSIVEGLDGLVIAEISCGHWHNLSLSRFGDIYSWGWNADRQLGHSLQSATVALPTLVDEHDSDMSFKSVSCGARHSTALSLCGVLLTWGWNGYGQLGHSHSKPAPPIFGQTCDRTEPVVLWHHCGPWNTSFLIHTHPVPSDAEN